MDEGKLMKSITSKIGIEVFIANKKRNIIAILATLLWCYLHLYLLLLKK